MSQWTTYCGILRSFMADGSPYAPSHYLWHHLVNARFHPYFCGNLAGNLPLLDQAMGWIMKVPTFVAPKATGPKQYEVFHAYTQVYACQETTKNESGEFLTSPPLANCVSCQGTWWKLPIPSIQESESDKVTRPMFAASLSNLSRKPLGSSVGWMSGPPWTWLDTWRKNSHIWNMLLFMLLVEECSALLSFKPLYVLPQIEIGTCNSSPFHDSL